MLRLFTFIVKKIKNKQGSYTVEAILIMSTLLVVLFLLCFSFMLMYNQVLLTKSAASLAQQLSLEFQGGPGVERYLSQVDKKIQKPENIAVEVEYNSGLITQEIKVILSQEIVVPFGQLKRFFSGKDTVVLTAEERIIVTDPAEFIRNTDLVLECANRVGQKIDFSELYTKIKAVK